MNHFRHNSLFMKFLKFLIIALSFTFLYSCDNATEEIYLNADGSGEYKMYSDMVPTMVQMMGMFAAMDTTFQGSTEELNASIAEKIWEDFPSEVDSIMPPKESDRGKYQDDPRKLELFDKMEGFMYGSKKRGYMNTGMRFKFKNMKELNEYMVMVNDQSADSGTGDLKVDMNYAYKRKCLKRVCNYSKIEPETEEEKAEAEMKNGVMDGMMEMFANSKATTIVHLPKNVKSVEGPGIKEKTDKVVIFEYSMLDILSGEADTNFEIKFK